MRSKAGDTARALRGPLMLTAVVVAASILAPSVYTILSLFHVVPMTVAIYVAWLGWLQVVHGAAAVVLWRRRHALSTRMKATALYWGGLAFWYWLPAPIYYLLTMNIDELQLKWTAFAFFWEVPVVGGAFVLAAQRLFPLRGRPAPAAAARTYREVMRYPTVVAALLFVFTLAGYSIGALQLRVFASLPLVEQIKNVSHGLVISLLLAVFYHLALDRVLEPLRARIAREAGVASVVARTVAGRILGVTLAVTVSGFALISLFVLQGFQGMVRESAAERLARDLPLLAAAPDAARRLGPVPAWGESGRLLLLHGGERLPAAEFSPATRRQVEAPGPVIVHDTRRDLKVVGAIDAPGLGGRLVGVVVLTDAYGPLMTAARLLAIAGGCVLVVTVGMLVFASRASTQAVRALSSAVRRVEAGEVDAGVLRLDTGDEIGELSAVVERYVRQSRDLRDNLEETVRAKTHRLEAMHHHLRAIVEHMPAGVVLLERDGRIVLANPLARGHLATVATLSPAGEVTALGGLPLARVLAAPKLELREIASEDGGGVFQVAVQRLADGQGAVVVIREVTREREAQKIAQQQARLASVGQLAAGIAHDFNNILMTIVTSGELAMRRQADAPFVRERLGVVVAQGERAAMLVRQILDFSRQSPPSLETVDLAQLLEQAVGLLERTLPESIRILVENGEGPFVVSADPNQLTQVLTNLAVNARDVMPLGGELRFRLAQERRATAADGSGPGPGDWIALSVTDTGSGMPPAVRERVFDPFFTTKAPGRGTGLGLSQAYGIVTEHQGHITVDSRAGQGTTFTLYLPSLPARGPAAVAEVGLDLARGGGETVLVVEDEAPVRHTLAHLLAELNYQVLTASSAENALEIHAAHAGQIALVLTDLVMPGMGGVGLVRELRQRSVQVPVVMMSGYVGDSSRATVEGVQAWVEKPVTALRLGIVIQEAMLARA
jgi:signal transduction histidine kinase